MQRPAIIAAAVLTALATGGVLAVSGGAQAPTGRTIQLVEKPYTEKFIDVKPRARREFDASAGDAFVFSARLLDSANNRAGTLYARCDFIKGGRRFGGVCTGVFALGDGDLLLSARLSEADTVTGAIVGGTGAYANARGTFTSVDRPGEAGGDPSDDTITLLP